MSAVRSPDVVVVGAGLAGWAAALSAAEHGAETLILEKQPTPGGSTVLSAGRMAFAGTAQQRALGIVDSAELLFDDLRMVGQDRNDAELVRAYADGQLELYGWLVDHGVRFVENDVQLLAGQSVPRTHAVDPRQTIAALRDAGLRAGAVERVEAPVAGLRPGTGGPQRWILTLADGADVAADAVVLATGGFTQSTGLLEHYAPSQARAIRLGGAGNTGDGLRMAVASGAGTRDFEFIKSTYGTHPSTGPDRHLILEMYYLGGLIVNASGHRFVDESLSYKLLGDACLDQPGAIGYQIFDSAMFRAGTGGGAGDLEGLSASGLVPSDATIDGLARTMGIDPSALVDAVQRYNASVREHGFDREFGRRHLCHTAGELKPLVEGPFYGFAAQPALIATYCGVTITPRAQVTTADRQPIPGLYAAGEVIGGFHGAAYMTGSSLGKSAFFGRRAGTSATADLGPHRSARS